MENKISKVLFYNVPGTVPNFVLIYFGNDVMLF